MADAGAGPGLGLSALRSEGGAPLNPLSRLRRLAMLEREDLGVVVIYAAVSGLVSLAIPIAAQSLVNTVAFTALVQPLVVLTVLVFAGLLVAGLMTTVQQVVIERLHQRFFVRATHDVTLRLLHADAHALRGRLAPDLTNRFFDVVVVQKAASTLLVDGLSAVLSATTSLLLLAFYHPALLAFDLVLLTCIAFVLFGLARGGVTTAVKESKVKHQIGAWLEHIAVALVPFKAPQASEFAFRRSDALARSYVESRAKHFKVLLRQIVASHVLRAMATAALLGLGGLLVIREQLTLGQLVAAEIAVTSALASLAKSSKSLESFYDLAAALDKVGSLVDLPSERETGIVAPARRGSASVALTNVSCDALDGGEPLRNVSFTATSDEWLTLLGEHSSGRATLLALMYGLVSPASGRVELDGNDVRNLRLEELRKDVMLVDRAQLFEGTVSENLSWGSGVDAGRMAAVLDVLDLGAVIAALPDGAETLISSTGYPFSDEQALRLTLARALQAEPRVLLLDGVLDALGVAAARKLASGLRTLSPALTVIVFTNRPDVALALGNVKRLEHGAVESPLEAA